MPNKLGTLAEQIAEKWLVENGFKILNKNVWLVRYGEIDIIAKKGSTHHFVEVKALHDAVDFSPEIHFTKAKKMKLEHLAQYFANKNNLENYQIDLIAVIISGNKTKIRHYPNL